MAIKQLILALLLCLTSHNVLANRFDHSVWDGLLRAHVVTKNSEQTSQVNYLGFAQYHGQLRQYLSQLEQVKKSNFFSWDRSEQLAFLINTYNAATIEMILRSYSSLFNLRAYAPVTLSWKTRLRSILKNQRELAFIALFGEFLSLNDIEDMIRKPEYFDEPRIHFVLHQGSIGSPALLNRAYTGIELENQLEKATRNFLSDRSHNRYNEEMERLEVSEIFDWYSKDFERGWQGWSSLGQFFTHYRDSLADTPRARELLKDEYIDIQFLEFNWLLNEKR
ncbi:DUF547 domain-containing protein [Nitrosomonas sp. JL21]|uniref:DUF547 domain-containing protein n=1 Tax=Nitrosomonas sp. JL21 TaxID=153949 RepID=UPI0023DCAA0A|nr:DUF547 domain-containing protein [Nitrosomonas sp. JL21]MXS78434.1 DUF547 domain-containing protein [Nitrosomonas sp. JL21]